jgi:Astacin (Peptidase family M12A)/FG-GAP repeat
VEPLSPEAQRGSSRLVRDKAISRLPNQHADSVTVRRPHRRDLARMGARGSSPSCATLARAGPNARKWARGQSKAAAAKVPGARQGAPSAPGRALVVPHALRHGLCSLLRQQQGGCKMDIRRSETTTWRWVGGVGASVICAFAMTACAQDEGDPLELGGAEEAFPGEHGEIRHGVIETPWGPRAMTYEWIHGVAVVEGDILLSGPGGKERGNSRTKQTKRWPGGVVPYTIDPTLPTPTRVTDAIANWESVTKFTFVPRTTEVDYLTFQPSAGCSSNVGRVGGQQFVNLAPTCLTGKTMHEIGHALGMWHEQSRADRDKHVIINWANITVGKEGNFDTFTTAGNDGRDIGAYDVTSIMHYGSDAFSANGLPTITLLDGSTFVEQRVAPTPADICAVKKFQGWGQRSDVNGDGYADLVIGVPNEDVGAVGNEGAIQVLFGGAAGLTSTNQFIHRDSASVEDVAGGNDQFGYAVTMGDFNGDCIADAAVGVPFDDVNGVADAGSVQIFYGTALGLGVSNDAVWHLASTNVVGDPVANDRFGTSLASGDFNGDGFDDVAVGIPYKDIGALTDTGSVTILYGSAAGISGTGSQLWNQNVSSMQDISSPNDHFGWALAAGDFDGDGFDELAVGVPDEDVGASVDAGVTQIIQGSIDGLTDVGNQLWTEDNGGIPDTSEAGDLFGFALAAGDLNSDGRVDLAIGVPLEDVGGIVDSGSVTVMYGTPTGLLTTGSQAWNQDTAGVLEAAEVSDVFGRALEIADFNSDGFPDLAVGAPFEDIGAVNSAGAIQLLNGGAAGVTTVGNSVWHQDTVGIADTAEAGDTYGYRLRAGDFDGDGVADVAIGVPSESVGATVGAGVVQVLKGRAGGVTSVGSQLWSQDSGGVLDTSETSDLFSYGL